MKKTHRQFMWLAGRVCIAMLLLVSGMQKLQWPGGTALYMMQVGIPGAGEALAKLVGAFELVVAVAILVGWRTREAAITMAVYLVPVTWYTHLAIAYRAADAMVRDQEITQSFKSLSLIGGLLLLGAAGPGEISVDRK